jgi:hypothetical protein
MDCLLHEKAPENLDVRAVLGTVHGQLVAKQLDRIGQQDRDSVRTQRELASQASFLLSRLQPGAADQEVHLLALPFQNGDEDAPWLWSLHDPGAD